MHFSESRGGELLLKLICSKTIQETKNYTLTENKISNPILVIGQTQVSSHDSQEHLESTLKCKFSGRNSMSHLLLIKALGLCTDVVSCILDFMCATIYFHYGMTYPSEDFKYIQCG